MRGRDDREEARTRALLWCGVLAGPLLVLVLLGQSLWRPGYDLGTDAISTLSLGPHGWVQITAFVVVGLLVAAFGLGVRRSGGDGRAARAGGVLLVVMGAGLVGLGVFVLDPVGWHGRLHDVSTGVVLNAAILAVVLLSVGWWREGRRGLVALGVGTALVGAALGWPADAVTIALRHTGAVLVLTVWLTTTALTLLHDDPGSR